MRFPPGRNEGIMEKHQSITMKRLDGPARARLRQILLRLLSQKQFDRLLNDYLNQDRETLALGESKEENFFEVITEADRGLWLVDLVEAARKFRPKDPELYEFAHLHYDLGVVGTPNADTLERIVMPKSTFINPADWRTRLAAIERQVCRISLPVPEGTAYGTGFLVAPSVVLTNYHVIKPIVEGKAKHENMTLQFDYKIVGEKAQDGKIVKLVDDAEKWLIDSSPYALADVMKNPTVSPTDEELDYAFLRLKEAIGDEPIGPASDPGAETRGVLKLAEAATEDPAAPSPVVIIQHPKGAPLAMAIEMQGLSGPNSNNTRLKYLTNTEGGSSGSPVFDINWKLIALHHSGDPDYSELHKPEYNQGVPIRLILALMKKHAKLNEIS
jgi:V8-like Glu-specific endopeptidase